MIVYGVKILVLLGVQGPPVALARLYEEGLLNPHAARQYQDPGVRSPTVYGVWWRRFQFLRDKYQLWIFPTRVCFSNTSLAVWDIILGNLFG